MSITPITGTFCSGYTYTDHGFHIELGGEGAYIDTIHFISNAGCDSLVIFNFTINPQKDTIINDNICQFDTYKENGFDTVLNVAGRHNLIKTFKTYQECDSVVVIRIDVYPTPVDAVDFDFVVGYPGSTTTFTNWSIVYNENAIDGWEWYLNDESSPFAYTKDASTVIETAGNHTVTLKVKGVNGCWNEITKDVIVPPCPVPTIIVAETVETCGLETVIITGSFTNADVIKVQTLNSRGKKAWVIVDNNTNTFTVTYNPTIANVGNTIQIILTATDSSTTCPGTTETISITVKPKPRVRFKGKCAE